ncbi:MAG: hypothetical protein E7083_00025 [Bacteroidales bacterium]|nr:hypothetical protein [Bacteroidales bacterium]
MTIYEVLKLYRGSLNILYEIGVNPEDYRYIDMYEEYVRLRNRGEKTTYIVAELSSKYDVSERNIYAVISRFKSDCKPFAVE